MSKSTAKNLKVTKSITAPAVPSKEEKKTLAPVTMPVPYKQLELSLLQQAFPNGIQPHQYPLILLSIIQGAKKDAAEAPAAPASEAPAAPAQEEAPATKEEAPAKKGKGKGKGKKDAAEAPGKVPASYGADQKPYNAHRVSKERVRVMQVMMQDIKRLRESGLSDSALSKLASCTVEQIGWYAEGHSAGQQHSRDAIREAAAALSSKK